MEVETGISKPAVAFERMVRVGEIFSSAPAGAAGFLVPGLPQDPLGPDDFSLGASGAGVALSATVARRPLRALATDTP